MKRIFLPTFIALAMGGAAQETYSDRLQAVDEYYPAPGQFINTMPEYSVGDDAATMAAKCTKSLTSDNPDERGMVCLGAYGGYMTFHFDHPVANVEGEPDLAIFGNSIRSQLFKDVVGGSAEPGIVMVSQDVNHNGLPDDPWYELAGSADKDSTDCLDNTLDWERRLIYGYDITYRRQGDRQPVAWTDNQNAAGTIERMDDFGHEQEYWPLWTGADELRFTGTRLPRNAWYFVQGKFKKQWVYMFLDYGYADNQQNTDTLGCAFNLEWAVEPLSRQPVRLTHADFFRVYTAVNQFVGQQGETSTEVAGAIDLHLNASIEAMTQRQEPETTGIAIQRSSANSPKPTVIYRYGPVVVERTANGTVRKRIDKK